MVGKRMMVLTVVEWRVRRCHERRLVIRERRVVLVLMTVIKMPMKVTMYYENDSDDHEEKKSDDQVNIFWIGQHMMSGLTKVLHRRLFRISCLRVRIACPAVEEVE